MPRVLEIAMQTVISRRGVAVVACPGDIALRDAVEQSPRLHFEEAQSSVTPSTQEIERLRSFSTIQENNNSWRCGCAELTPN